MRKWIVLFLSLVVLSGAVYPCCPQDDCGEIQTASGSHEEENKPEACSPFYACTTCPGVAQLSYFPSVETMPLILPVHSDKFFVSSTSAYSSSSFKPPRKMVRG